MTESVSCPVAGRGRGAAKLVAVLLLATFAAAGASLDARAELSLSSPSLQAGEQMPLEHVHHSCGGENLSPALSWSGAPEGTRSFALMVYDPDAVGGSSAGTGGSDKSGSDTKSSDGWWHWVIFNIPAAATSLQAGAGTPKNGLVPEAIQLHNDFGAPGYGGACPPRGDGVHRYQFRLYALGVETLPLADSATPAQVRSQVLANSLARAQLEVTWGRE